MFCHIAFFLVFLVFSAALHAAPPKEALLIANGKYSHFAGLAHPSPDAAKLSAALEQLGFRVRVVRDGNREQMLDAISEFERGLRNTGAIAFFHYGGHGVQVDGKNYLLPADADIPDERRVATRAVALDEVMTAMDAAAARASIIVIDACRDNPLPTGSDRNLARGLSVVGMKPKNSIVIYAAEAGSKALDGLFTPILAVALQQKGRTIDQVMKSVRSEVYAKSSGQQTPGEYNQLFEELFLGEPAGDNLAPEKVFATKPAPTPHVSPKPGSLKKDDIAPSEGVTMPEDSTKASIEAVLSDFDQNKTNEALAKLAVLEKQRPNDPLVLNLVGSAYTKKKNYLAAETYFRKAVKKSPGFFPAMFNLGEILLLQKKYPEARQHFESLKAQGARHELLQFKLVLCDLQMNDYESANRIFESMQIPGESPARYYTKAVLEKKRGNTSKAREQIEAARRIFVGKTGLFDESLKAVGFNF
jgi:Tfp pilus assembly protein PilF